MRIISALLFFAVAHLAAAQEIWHVTADTLPKLRKMSMEDFGKVPTSDDLAMVDRILQGTEYIFIRSDSIIELVVKRTDVETTPTRYTLKKEPSGIFSGTNNGFTRPTIYLAQIDESRFLIWHSTPIQSYQIEKKK